MTLAYRLRTICLFFSFLLSLSPALASTETVYQTAENLPTAEADAINLIIDKQYRLEENGNSQLRLYVKRRIQSYKGKKDHADFKYTYNQAWESVDIITARTITQDGRALTPGPKEIHDIPAPWRSEVSRYSSLRQRVISLPAVEPGSTIEIELEVKNRRPLFFQEEYFRLYDPIISKKVSLDCPADMTMRWLKPQTVNLVCSTKDIASGRRLYNWQGENIAARTRETMAAPASLSGETLKITSAASWEAVGNYFQSLLALGAAGLEPATRDHIDRRPTTAAEIYRRLSRLKCYDLPLSDADRQTQLPAKTRQLGYGTSLDLARLFLDELRQSGYQGKLLLARSPDDWLSEAGFPWPGGWDLPVVLVDNQFFRFSPAHPAPGITGLNQVSALLVQNGKRINVKDLRPPVSFSELDLTLNEQLHWQGSFALNCQGAAATSERQKWRDLAPAEEEIACRRLLHQIAPQAAARGPLQISGLERKTANAENFHIALAIDIDASSGMNEVPDGRQLLIPLPPPEALADYLGLLQRRENPLMLPESRKHTEIIRLQLPADAKVIEPAGDYLKESSCKGLESTVSYRRDDHNRLTWERTIELKKSLLAPDSDAYRDFVLAVRRLAEPKNLRLRLKLAAIPQPAR